VNEKLHDVIAIDFLPKINPFKVYQNWPIYKLIVYKEMSSFSTHNGIHQPACRNQKV